MTLRIKAPSFFWHCRTRPSQEHAEATYTNKMADQDLNLQEIHDTLIEIAREAGRMILSVDPTDIDTGTKLNCTFLSKTRRTYPANDAPPLIELLEEFRHIFHFLHQHQSTTSLAESLFAPLAAMQCAQFYLT